jgi:hypothetical protein
VLDLCNTTDIKLQINRSLRYCQVRQWKTQLSKLLTPNYISVQYPSATAIFDTTDGDLASRSERRVGTLASQVQSSVGTASIHRIHLDVYPIALYHLPPPLFSITLPGNWVNRDLAGSRDITTTVYGRLTHVPTESHTVANSEFSGSELLSNVSPSRLFRLQMLSLICAGPPVSGSLRCTEIFLIQIRVKFVLSGRPGDQKLVTV